MSASSTITIDSNVTIEIRDKEGCLVDTRKIKNLVTDAGLNYTRDLFGYPDALFTSSVTPNFIALGSNDTAVTASDVSLGNELYREENSLKSPDDKKFIIRLFLDTSQGNGNTYKEAGVYSTGAGGKCWSRCVFAAIPKTSSITLTIHWEWSLGAS
jgi:hypothetical protein